MTAVDARWVVRHGVRYWEGGTFPEPADDELDWQISTRALDSGGSACGDRRGSPAGDRRHYRASERPCEDCRHAANMARNDREQKRPKTKKCVDCGTPITRAATRCRSCGCGRWHAHQTERKEAA